MVSQNLSEATSKICASENVHVSLMYFYQPSDSSRFFFTTPFTRRGFSAFAKQRATYPLVLDRNKQSIHTFYGTVARKTWPLISDRTVSAESYTVPLLIHLRPPCRSCHIRHRCSSRGALPRAAAAIADPMLCRRHNHSCTPRPRYTPLHQFHAHIQ